MVILINKTLKLLLLSRRFALRYEVLAVALLNITLPGMTLEIGMPPHWKGVFIFMQLIDSYQRRFKYLRLSITERCNFQCQYCLPDGYQGDKSYSFLSVNEIQQVVNAFAELGVNKIRLTGGEPTLRRDFLDIVNVVSAHPLINILALTTNGYKAKQNVKEWHEAGLTAINISMDSLSPEHFKMITGQDRLYDVLAGVDKALAVGMQSVKVNTVLMKGLNDRLHDYLNWIKDRPIELRFIELMETGEGSPIFNQYHTSGLLLEKQLLEQGWTLQAKHELSGPAKVYSHPDYLGKIGLIMPYIKDFCSSCNRLRVSSSGKLHFCLFGHEGLDIRDLLQDQNQSDALKERILKGLVNKPESHYLQEHNTGIIQNLSVIGG